MIYTPKHINFPFDISITPITGQSNSTLIDTHQPTRLAFAVTERKEIKTKK